MWLRASDVTVTKKSAQVFEETQMGAESRMHGLLDGQSSFVTSDRPNGFGRPFWGDLRSQRIRVPRSFAYGILYITRQE